MRSFPAVLALLLAPTVALAQPLPEGAVARLGTVAYRTDAGWRAWRSLSPGGRWLAESHPDRVVVRDLATGAVAYTLADPVKVKAIVQEHGRITNHTAVFTPDGKHLLTNDGGFRIQVWEAATGKWVRAVTGPEKVAEIPAGNTFKYEVSDLVACPKAGQLLVRVGSGYTFHVDPADWSWRYAGQFYDDLTAVSGDGRVAATHHNVDALYEECGIGPVDGKGGITVHLADGAWYAAISPDGKRAAVAGYRLTLVDVATGKETVPAGGERPLRGIIRGLRFSPDGTTLFATGDGHPAVARWDAATGKRLPDLAKVPGGVSWFDLTADGKTLVVVGGDAVIRRFALPDGTEVPPPDGFSAPLAVALAADGETAAVGDAAGAVRVWPAPFAGSGVTFRKGGAAVDDLAFSADGKTLFTLAPDGTATAWDVAAAKEAKTFRPPALKAPEFVRTARLAVAPDGKTLVASLPYHATWAWDTASGEILWHMLPQAGADREVGNAVAGAGPVFAPDGSLVLGLVRGTVGRYDARTGAEQKLYRLPPAKLNFRWDVGLVAVSADGRQLLAQCNYNQGIVYRVDVVTGAVREWKRFDWAARGLAFDATGGRVVTAHHDGPLRVWAADGTESRAGGPAFALALSADRRLAVALAAGATALVWRLP